MDALPASQPAAIREALAASPGGVLEEIARGQGATYAAVLEALDHGQALRAPGSAFDEVWADLADWPGEVTFIVHTLDGVFETRGRIPPGSHGRGYFNLGGGSPVGGHIRAARCAAIYLVDRPFMTRRSCSVQFLNGEGETMFKVFVGRDGERQLLPDQLARFEALQARVSAGRLESAGPADG